MLGTLRKKSTLGKLSTFNSVKVFQNLVKLSLRSAQALRMLLIIRHSDTAKCLSTKTIFRRVLELLESFGGVTRICQFSERL